MKIIIIISLIFLLVSCGNINTNKEVEINNSFNEYYQGSLGLDGVIVDFDSINTGGGEKLRKLMYSNFDNIVIEMGSSSFLEGIENYKGKELLIHIAYDVWKENSINILTKLKDLDLRLISINIRDNYNITGNEKLRENTIDSIVLKKEDAILFSKMKSKYKNLTLTMGKYGIGKIICSDEVLKILGIKKEECSIIQMKDGKAL